MTEGTRTEDFQDVTPAAKEVSEARAELNQATHEAEAKVEQGEIQAAEETQKEFTALVDSIPTADGESGTEGSAVAEAMEAKPVEISLSLDDVKVDGVGEGGITITAAETAAEDSALQAAAEGSEIPIAVGDSDESDFTIVGPDGESGEKVDLGQNDVDHSKSVTEVAHGSDGPGADIHDGVRTAAEGKQGEVDALGIDPPGSVEIPEMDPGNGGPGEMVDAGLPGPDQMSELMDLVNSAAVGEDDRIGLPAEITDALDEYNHQLNLQFLGANNESEAIRAYGNVQIAIGQAVKGDHGKLLELTGKQNAGIPLEDHEEEWLTDQAKKEEERRARENKSGDSSGGSDEQGSTTPPDTSPESYDPEAPVKVLGKTDHTLGGLIKNPLPEVSPMDEQDLQQSMSQPEDDESGNRPPVIAYDPGSATDPYAQYTGEESGGNSGPIGDLDPDGTLIDEPKKVFGGESDGVMLANEEGNNASDVADNPPPQSDIGSGVDPNLPGSGPAAGRSEVGSDVQDETKPGEYNFQFEIQGNTPEMGKIRRQELSETYVSVGDTEAADGTGLAAPFVPGGSILSAALRRDDGEDAPPTDTDPNNESSEFTPPPDLSDFMQVQTDEDGKVIYDSDGNPVYSIDFDAYNAAYDEWMAAQEEMISNGEVADADTDGSQETNYQNLENYSVQELENYKQNLTIARSYLANSLTSLNGQINFYQDNGSFMSNQPTDGRINYTYVNIVTDPVLEVQILAGEVMFHHQGCLQAIEHVTASMANVNAAIDAVNAALNS